MSPNAKFRSFCFVYCASKMAFINLSIGNNMIQKCLIEFAITWQHLFLYTPHERGTPREGFFSEYHLRATFYERCSIL